MSAPLTEPNAGPESREVRLKRMRIRAWRRGIKEMDLVLGGYANDELAGMSDAQLDLFEAVMGENDHDILQWVTRQVEPPARYADMIADLGRRAAQAQ